jgi:hypothetical protein
VVVVLVVFVVMMVIAIIVVIVTTIPAGRPGHFHLPSLSLPVGCVITRTPSRLSSMS